MASKLLGVQQTLKAFEELGNLTAPEWKSTMRASVRRPMAEVKKRAERKLARISPGKTPLHKTYRGRIVSAGFAARNMRLIVELARNGASVRAILGVRAEAFYAVQFFEKGTAKIPAQPFLVPSLEESKDTAVEGVTEAWQKRLNTIARKRLATMPKSAA